MVKAKSQEAEKVLSEADGFRLGVDPTPDDVHTANWLIDRLSALAQPVTQQEAARVLLEYLQNLDESHVWEQAQKAQEALMSESADVVLAALRAIATPPQEKALQELADLGQEFDSAPQEKDDE